MIKEIAYQNREEWLSLRKNYIGGSDAGAVLGMNPYKSAYSLWAEKSGKIEGFEGNSKVDLFLDGLYDNLNQIVFHVKYVHVAIGGYFMLRNRFIKDILSVVSDNGLLGTEDDIEDYGDHFYFTTNCEKWLEQ